MVVVVDSERERELERVVDSDVVGDGGETAREGSCGGGEDDVIVSCVEDRPNVERRRRAFFKGIAGEDSVDGEGRASKYD